MSDENAKLEQLLAVWKADMEAFAESFDIRDKELNIIPFIATQPQKQVFTTVSTCRKSFILKGRQMFVTTAVAICALRDCLFKPGMRVCVAAHDDKAAIEVGQFYIALHAGNELLRELMPVVRSRDHKIVFGNGSKILIGTANSEFWRGFPTHFAHLTEAALYDDMGKTLASLGQTVPKNGTMVVESTAFGENDFYHMWNDKRSTYAKTFLCWKDHHEYRANEALPKDLTDDERRYIVAHGLERDQASWYVMTRRSLPPDKLPMFDQEYPATAEMAFLLSGNKFLSRQIKAPAPLPVESGITRLEQFDPKAQYVAGIDVASGSADGDFSTLVIGNLTRKTIAMTLEIRMPEAEFKYLARRMVAEYGDPTTTIEVTTIGVDTCDYFRQEGVPQYMTERLKGITATLTSQYGWEMNPQTRPLLFGRIFEASIGPNPWTINCRRLVDQLNALCYDRNHKPQAPNGQHDDLAVAFGLMLMAAPQATSPKQVEVDQRTVLPATVFEEIAYIKKFGWDALKKLRERDMLRHEVPAEYEHVPLY